MRILFFGCWNQAGHFMFSRGGGQPRHYGGAEYYGGDEQIKIHLDGTLAPRRMKPYYGGEITWQGKGKTREERDHILYNSEELPQGQFIRHVLDNGFTAIQWWDRQQGDSRGACNSTVLFEGEHTTEEMLAALKEHFPHVLANLNRAGIELVEVAK